MNFQRQPATKTAAQPAPSSSDPRTPNAPVYRVWLIQDRDDGRKPDWYDLTGLWLTKDGSGLTGQVDRPVPIQNGKLVGRIVVLPEKDRAASAEGGA